MEKEYEICEKEKKCVCSYIRNDPQMNKQGQRVWVSAT